MAKCRAAGFCTCRKSGVGKHVRPKAQSHDFGPALPGAAQRLQQRRIRARFGMLPERAQRVLLTHDDGTHSVYRRQAHVKHYNVRREFFQALRVRRDPDGIPGHVQRLFTLCRKDQAARVAQPLGNLGDSVRLIAAVLAVSFCNVDARDDVGVCQHADRRKALRAQERRVALILRVNHPVLGNQLLRRLVPVILMRVRYDNHVHIQQLFNGNRQRDHGVAQVRTRGTRKTGPGFFVRKHRVDEEADAGIIELQRGVTYLSQLHSLLLQRNRSRAVCALSRQYKKAAGRA